MARVLVGLLAVCAAVESAALDSTAAAVAIWPREAAGTLASVRAAGLSPARAPSEAELPNTTLARCLNQLPNALVNSLALTQMALYRSQQPTAASSVRQPRLGASMQRCERAPTCCDYEHLPLHIRHLFDADRSPPTRQQYRRTHCSAL